MNQDQERALRIIGARDDELHALRSIAYRGARDEELRVIAENWTCYAADSVLAALAEVRCRIHERATSGLARTYLMLMEACLDPDPDPHA